jgi:hypothetical protein
MFQQLIKDLDLLPLHVAPEDLNMPNLIQFPPGTFKFLMWIIRSKSVQFSALVEYLEQDEAAVLGFLETLVQRGILETSGVGDSKQYRVKMFSARSHRVPDKFWKAFED